MPAVEAPSGSTGTPARYVNSGADVGLALVAPIEIKDGKYGIYVTDGTTNATLPKPADPGAVTLQQALELLAARAARKK